MNKSDTSVSKLVRDKINKFSEGAVFTLDDFQNIGSRGAIAITLSRLVSDGSIIRIRRGLYMVPKESRFGSLPPASSSVINVLSRQGKKSYESGVSAANKLGLTTQVPNTIELTGGAADSSIEIGSIKIKIKAGKSPAKKSDIPLMVLLDLIRGIKKIPGSTLVEVISVLKFKVDQLAKIKKVRLVTLALKDKPMVKAVLGAILDELNPEVTSTLYESLNSLTSYQLGNTGLKFSKKWRIK
ncbi:MAG: hypothetical protein KAG61_01460 [Bacteriovoracaceae bacterium]|nr:hypothetical protein [Bacteriovoracaceae bacterium]